MVRVDRAPAEDIGRGMSVTRIFRRGRARQPPQKRLVEIPPLRQRPTIGGLERRSRERDAGMEAACGLFFSKLAGEEA